MSVSVKDIVEYMQHACDNGLVASASVEIDPIPAAVMVGSREESRCLAPVHVCFRTWRSDREESLSSTDRSELLRALRKRLDG